MTGQGTGRKENECKGFKLKTRRWVGRLEDEGGRIWERFVSGVSCLCNVLGQPVQGNLKVLQWSWAPGHFWFRSAYFLVGPCALLVGEVMQSKKGWAKPLQKLRKGHWKPESDHMSSRYANRGWPSFSLNESVHSPSLPFGEEWRKHVFFQWPISLQCVSSAFDNCWS